MHCQGKKVSTDVRRQKQKNLLLTFLACRYATALAMSVAKLILSLQGNGVELLAIKVRRFPPGIYSDTIWTPESVSLNLRVKNQGLLQRFCFHREAHEQAPKTIQCWGGDIPSGANVPA